MKNYARLTIRRTDSQTAKVTSSGNEFEFFVGATKLFPKGRDVTAYMYPGYNYVWRSPKKNTVVEFRLDTVASWYKMNYNARFRTRRTLCLESVIRFLNVLYGEELPSVVTVVVPHG